MKDLIYKLLEDHYRANFNGIVLRVNRYVKNWHNSEDIVQEGYTRAFKYWEAFPDAGDIDKWINSIIVNCSRDHHRSELLRGMSDSSELPEPAIGPAGDSAVANSEILSMVLSKETALCQVLYFSLFRDWSPVDIVKAGLADTPGQVRTIVSRFRTDLKDIYA